MPCYYTFRAILSSLDQALLVEEFIKWVKATLPIGTDDFVALDGKAIKASTEGGRSSLQNFVAVVNAFGHQSGVVYGMQAYQNGKSGEAQALRELVQRLGVKDKVFTMDALHTQKKPSI